jgi:Protein of unknown function (DUF4435)
MRWKLSEFIYEMEQDAQRRVFFVEGIRDQVFWSKTLQFARRSGTVIYSISILDCDAVSGGERGRLVWVANQLSTSSIAGRLRYFADADFDRLLQIPVPESILLTDGRDLESYFFLGNCCDHLCTSVQPGVADAHQIFRGHITSIARPLGILRLASVRNQLHLPFKRTLEKGLHRFVVTNNSTFELDVNAVVRTLLQNAGQSTTNAPHVMAQYVHEQAVQAATPDNQIIHGKDLARLIAWKYKIAQSFAENFVMLALTTEKATIRTQPNIQAAAAWLN